MLKPPGMTSNDLVTLVRRALPRGVMVCHGGTLDPDAAGVLPVCVGKATRLFDVLIDKEKTYIALLRLGVETDAQDASGRVVARADASRVTRKEIEALLPRFTGEIDQVPPAYSAIKRDGVRMYEMARKGGAEPLPPRRVEVLSVDCLSQESADAYLMRVVCRKGVYIRTLCHDIGRALGVGGHMAMLIRQSAGAFHIDDAVTVEALESARRADAVESLIVRMDAPLEHLPRIDLPGFRRDDVVNGRPIIQDAGALAHPAGETLRLYVDGAFAGLARVDEDGSIRVKAMLLEMNR